MAELILHSYRRCPFAIRVRMTLEEKGLKYSVIEESLKTPSDELLRMHPEGKVPLLVHDGHPLFESAVITEYLEDAFPEVSLMPATALERAELRLWTFWCNHLFKPDLDAFKYKFNSLPEAEQRALLGRLQGHLAKLEKALDGWPYLLGGDFTLADIHVFPFYRQLMRSQPDVNSLLGQFPLTKDWLDRIMTRPSWEKAMEKRG